MEYYSSLENFMKVKASMYPQRSSGEKKVSKLSSQSNPIEDDTIQCRGAGGASVEVTSEELDSSTEDAASVCRSLVSGPSHPSPLKQRLSQFLCKTCRELYQKARKAKAPIKDKLREKDPKSLTCDRWVLLKKWKPKRLVNVKGKLLVRLPLNEETDNSSGCLRAHPFLQRNLRRANIPPNKRINRGKRKRTKNYFYGYQVAKQQRLKCNGDRQLISINVEDDDLASVMETSSVQQNSKKKRGFREQLMLLRESTIVRETH